jgi:hypothetical protein
MTPALPEGITRAAPAPRAAIHDRRMMVWINVVGGIGVLGSYVHGFATNPATRGELWGAVPDAIQPLYTVSMFLAAAGYLAFTYVIFRHVDPEDARIGRRRALPALNALYVAILLPSALWMPLTFSMLANPGQMLWTGIRLALFVVGGASIGLLAALLRLRPRPPGAAYGVAVAGSVAFLFQTAVLDALIWPMFFPYP